MENTNYSFLDTVKKFSEYLDSFKEANKITGDIVSEEMLYWLTENCFFEMPASTKYHLNYKGGLFEHSLNVAKQLENLTAANNLVWQRPESPFIIGMFHDLCKHDAYEFDGSAWLYNNDQMIKGHGDKSIMLLSQFMTLTEEEILCIRYHMGAYEKESWDQYDKAIRKYPNVLWTHQADMLASKVDEK